MCMKLVQLLEILFLIDNEKSPIKWTLVPWGDTLTMIGLKRIGHHSSLPLSSKLGTPN